MKNHKYLIDEYPLLVFPTLAKMIGLPQAIILQQVHYWTNIDSAKIKEGKKWCYNSYPKWQKQFPFWDIKTVIRTIKELEKSGFLISANFNKLKIDKTKWYRINYVKYVGFIEKLTAKPVKCHMDKMSRPGVQNVQTNTRSTSDSNTLFVPNKSICVSHETRQKNLGKNLKETQTEEIINKTKTSAFTQKVLKYWNCLPNITPHKKPSKTWLEVKKGINLLRKGNLYKKKFDKQFLKRNKIPESLLRYKFSKQEIMTTLKKVSQWCEQGYLIQSSGFKITLPNAIYNPFGNIQSVFLIACVRDPEPMIKELQNKYPEITVCFEKESGIKLKGKGLNQVLQNLNRLNIYYQKNIQGKQMGYSLSNKMGNFSQMCISFVNWLKENHANENLPDEIKYNSAFMFSFNGFLFVKFIKWINKQYNCTF